MGRTYTIDLIPTDRTWWGHTDAGRFALMAQEDDLLDEREVNRLWGTDDLGAVRAAIEERAERLATARGRGEARGLRVVSHTRNIHTRDTGGNTQAQDFPATEEHVSLNSLERADLIADIVARLHRCPDAELRQHHAALTAEFGPLRS